jgi:hypothetical protein
MRVARFRFSLIAIFLAGGLAVPASAQVKGAKTISGEAMKPHLKFLGAKEFRGRSAPSVELDIAARYIAVEAARLGLKPLMPDGSYFQPVPVEVTTLSPARSLLRVLDERGETRFTFPRAFTAPVRTGTEWAAGGGVVFVGAPAAGHAESAERLTSVDLRGKVAVVLEVPVPAGAAPGLAGSLASARARVLRDLGAVAVVSIISAAREATLAEKGLVFDVAERLRFLEVDTVNPAPPPAPGQALINIISCRR